MAKAMKPISGIRTVRGGRMKLHNRWWVPNDRYQVYAGRLDGLRFLFMEYPQGDIVTLWGTEAAVKKGVPGDAGPECVDGYYPWYFWYLA